MITGITPPDTGRPMAARFMRHLTVLAVVLVACLVWVMTHEACRYPLGNGICSLVAFIGVPIRLICLLEAEAGVE